MTFLNPLYLIALAAAGIPILLHLMNLRKSRVIEFSTLTFLKELQKSKIRKLKLKQWLLLALRTLIVIFMVLAFTRPAMKSTFGFLPGARAKTSVVVILDDSFSMLTSDDGGQLLKQAKEKARAILDIMKPGDEVSLIRTSEAQRDGKQFTAAVSAVRNEIDATQPSFRHVNYIDALTAASILLQKSSNFNKELYMISDEQRSHYFNEAAVKTPKLFDAGVKLFLFPLGDAHVGNTAVTDVKIINSFFEQNRPVDLNATVLNDGASSISNGIVSVFLDGERVLQKSFDVDAGARKQLDFTVVPKRTGFIEGFIELEDDALPEDNRRYFALYVPEQLHILVAPGGSLDATIVRLALKPSTAADAPSVFQIDAVDKNSMLSANLSKYDAVILLGAQAATPGFVSRLASYIHDGGGVVIFPDPDGNLQSFSQVLLPALALPPTGGTNGSLTNKSTQTTFGTTDFDHPLFKSIFVQKDKNKKPEIESPRIAFNVRLRGNENSQQIIATSAGDAFLLEHRLGKGKALVFGVAPNLQWSDFPLKGIFLPLLNRAMFYLAAREDYVHGDIVGHPFELSLPTGSSASLYDLRMPNGNVLRMTPKNLPSGLFFSMDNLDQPGVYQLICDAKVVRKIPVNIDPSESELRKISSPERDAFFKGVGITMVKRLDKNANVQQAVTEARFGVELWKYMLGLALLFALAEMFIARDVKQAEQELSKG